MLHGPLRYAILFGYDGVFETMVGTADSMTLAKKCLKLCVRQLHTSRDHLAILDASTGRLVSYVL